MRLTIERPEIHIHKPCGHRDRCAAPKGGCQKCARDRQIAIGRERGWW